MTKIIGISAFYHDSAAALIVDGEIVAAAQEERFTRIKHDPGYPKNSIEFILKESNLQINDIDHVVFYDKPFLKFERLLETYLAFAPKGFLSFSKAMPLWLREKLFLKSLLFNKLTELNKDFDKKKLLFSEHHFSHAASAYYPSPFSEAVVLTLDGVGEWATTTIAHGKGNKLNIEKEIHFPHSLGLLYSAFTYYVGFKVNSGEYKLMGLAPYGQPIYEDLIVRNLIDIKQDGSFRLNQSYFNYATGLKMINKKFINLFGKNPRIPEVEEIGQFHMDIAASIQLVTEKIVILIAKNIASEYKIKNLCLAGGVALNCVANGKLIKEKIFENIWIQPAAGDAGGAIGAALGYYYSELKNDRKVEVHDSMKGSFLGPEFSDTTSKNILDSLGANYSEFSYEKMLEITAENLNCGKAIGWFQGKMEFGPRALGSRSIIGDPRNKSMQKNLNLKVKYRESFRPFAPSVLEENVSKYFNLDVPSPYMLIVAEVNKDIQKNMTSSEKELFGISKLNIVRSDIPAVTHVDYSARIQTVNKLQNKKYYDLIKKFNDLSGCSVIINTSFNIRGEPIVCSPEDAFKCFMGTELDMLVIGNIVLRKEKQKNDLISDYKSQFQLD